jgi:hypothetical protein
MTQQELDAIPEQSIDFGMREETIDGRTVRIPVAPRLGPLYQGENDVMFVRDVNGVAWTTGWDSGVLVKRRIRGR